MGFGSRVCWRLFSDEDDWSIPLSIDWKEMAWVKEITLDGRAPNTGPKQHHTLAVYQQAPAQLCPTSCHAKLIANDDDEERRHEIITGGGKTRFVSIAAHWGPIAFIDLCRDNPSLATGD